MLKRLKIFFFRLKRKLPEQKIIEDYYEMVQRLKQLEAQVEQRATQLEQAKSSFLKNLYHEIRTPLNAVIGFTNLLSEPEKYAEESREEFAGIVNKSSTEFLRKMDDLIVASLLEAGMIKINQEEFSPEELCQELHSYFTVRKHQMEKSNIALLMNLPTANPELTCMGDKYQISQVLSQMLENAFKFTEKGIIEFGYTIKNRQLVFYVKDSGTGRLEGKEKFIFLRFAKLEFDSAKNGLGLGLSICKNLAELMDGKIWYTSNVPKGSCFYLSIPYKPIEKPELEKSSTGRFIENAIGIQNSLAV